MSENKFNSILQDKIDKEKNKENKKSIFKKNKNYEQDDQRHKENIFIKSFKDFADFISVIIGFLTVFSCITVLIIVGIFVATRFNPNLWYWVNETLNRIAEMAKMTWETMQSYIN